MKRQILQWIEEHLEEIRQTYRHLHSIAEISWQEHETTRFIRNRLDELPMSSHSFDEHTGVVAEWSGDDSGLIVALRSDIDALWQKVGDSWKANHSCGHDAHMTMVLSALQCLKEVGYRPKGKLVVVFQPAEETGEGAIKFVESGILDEVDYLLGIHLRPRVEMPFGKASSAIYHGAAAFLHGKVTGLQAHAARPHEGINVIDSVAAIVNAVNAVKVNPLVPASCKVTKINTNNINVNIIPDTAEFAVDLRAKTNEAMEDLIGKVKQAASAGGSMNGAAVEMVIGNRMAAAIADPYMEKIVGQAIVDILGETGYDSPPMTPGSEDFHNYRMLKPDLKATMIGLGCDLAPGLHHPDMSFNPDCLRNGIAVLALSVVHLFEQKT